MTSEIRKTLASSVDHPLLFADGFDEAILGLWKGRVAYSIEKILLILSRDMSLDDALEYYQFNIEGAYVGKRTPIYIDDLALPLEPPRD